MEKTISAAEANRQFSALLRGVREGNSYIVTSRGRAVAKIESVEAQDGADQARRTLALDALLKRLRSQAPSYIGPWTREELYEDEK